MIETVEPIEEWGIPEPEKQSDDQNRGGVRKPRKQSHTFSSEDDFGHPEEFKKPAWFSHELAEIEATANLDAQAPATLYYLQKVTRVPQVVAIYVEDSNGSVKHWAVLSERDYEAMEEIYEIEQDSLNRFPVKDLNFRVTVDSEGGPTSSSDAIKIYERQ